MGDHDREAPLQIIIIMIVILLCCIYCVHVFIVAPIITPVTQTFVAEENMPFTVTVTVSANPQQTGYFWEDNVQRLSNSSRVSLSLTYIRFMRALREDAGIYTLSVTNMVGTSTFSFNLTVACK